VAAIRGTSGKTCSGEVRRQAGRGIRVYTGRRERRDLDGAVKSGRCERESRKKRSRYQVCKWGGEASADHTFSKRIKGATALPTRKLSSGERE